MQIRIANLLAVDLSLGARRGHHDGGKGATGSEAGAVDVEGDGDGDEKGCDAAEEGGGPLDAEAVEHLVGEEGEGCAREGAEEGVGCDGRGGAEELQSVFSSSSFQSVKVGTSLTT